MYHETRQGFAYCKKEVHCARHGQESIVKRYGQESVVNRVRASACTKHGTFMYK